MLLLIRPYPTHENKALKPGSHLSNGIWCIEMYLISKVPSTINQYLREYQKEGIAFLYRQYSSGKGAILADDMGLGKTVQVKNYNLQNHSCTKIFNYRVSQKKVLRFDS